MTPPQALSETSVHAHTVHGGKYIQVPVVRPHAPNVPLSGKNKVLTQAVICELQSAFEEHVELQSATASNMHLVEPSTMPAHPQPAPQAAAQVVQVPFEQAGVDVTPHRQVRVPPQPSGFGPQTLPRLAQVVGMQGWHVPFVHLRFPQHEPTIPSPQASPCC